MALIGKTTYGGSENILDSEVGLVVKTRQATQSLATVVGAKKFIYAGTLFLGTEVTYTAVTPTDSDNPSTNGWYELSGTTYSASTDTTVSEGKTYYAKSNPVDGIVFTDIDMTDDDKRPIPIVVAGRLKKDKVSAEAQAKAEEFRAQGLYLV